MEASGDIRLSLGLMRACFEDKQRVGGWAGGLAGMGGSRVGGKDGA